MSLCIVLACPFVIYSMSDSIKAKSSISLSKAKLNLYVGQTYKFRNKKCKWLSSNKKVVTVTNNGKVKAVKPGSARITVSLKANKKIKKTCNVKVGHYLKTMSVTNAATIVLKNGQKSKINLRLTPSKVLYKDATFKSSNEKIAKVDKNGNVSAVSVGNTVININSKAVRSNGKKIKKSVRIVVIEQDTPTPAPGEIDTTEDVFNTTKDFVTIVPIPSVTKGPEQTVNPVVTPTPLATATPVVTSEPVPDGTPLPGQTTPPEDVPTREPVKEPTMTPEPTPAPPMTTEEYIASLKPDANQPLVGSFVVSNGSSYRTIYLLNKQYTGNIKLTIEDYIYSGNDNVSKLLSRLEKEHIAMTNSAGTVKVSRRPKEVLWTVEFLLTGRKYYFSGQVNDTTFNTPYGIVIADGNTLDSIRITTN